jgi:hypothetical protein
MKMTWVLMMGGTLVALTQPASALRGLTLAQVRSTFGTGVAFSASNVGGKTYSMVLSADGTAKRTPEASTTSETGSWRAAGPGYCSKWGQATAEQCYTIEQFTATVYRVYNSSSKVIAYWSK